MKILLPFLLLPSLVLAQAPEEQTSAPPSFDQFKKTMGPIIEKTLPTMKETRECVSKAESKEDMEKCMNAMAQKVQEIQQQSGGQGKAVTSKTPDDFKWTPENKKMMLTGMDRSIKRNTAIHECLGTSNTREEADNCMRTKMPMKKIQKKVQ
ncbi:MAG: hypothetical protein ABFS39_18370 [Pseudomonadota bacterium]